MGYALVQPIDRPLNGCAHSSDTDDIFRSCPLPGLLVAFVEHGQYVYTPTYKQGSYSLGSAEFVGGHGEKVYAQRLYINGNVPDSLGGIRMGQPQKFAGLFK